MTQARRTTRSTQRKKALKSTSTRATVRAKATKAVKITKAIKEKQSRVEILQHISDTTSLKRVEVQAVFVELAKLIKGHMKRGGSGSFTIPWAGVKLKKRKRKATKKRTMVSPLTGSEVVIPAKPSRDEVKLIALKVLKETISG
jgi:hypothetical protein